MDVPTVVTHYHLADRRPFLNLSDLDAPDVEEVLGELAALRRAGRLRRPFGRPYLELRRLTEARMRDLFVRAGGAPERQAPHYFVLGESRWFEGLADQLARVQLPLSALPPAQVSLTYPDSVVAMGYGPRFGLPPYEGPGLGRVFRLAELDVLVEQAGIPAPAWEQRHTDWSTWPVEAFVEVQLWSDEPVSAYVS